MDMPPKFKNLAADLAFKTRNKGRRRNHDRHAERYRNDCDADNEPGKIFPARKSDATGYEKGKVHELRFTNWDLRIGTDANVSHPEAQRQI